MSFFKAAQDLKRDSMQNFLSLLENFERDMFKIHFSFRTANLSESLKMTGFDSYTYGHKELENCIILAKNINTSRCDTTIIATDGVSTKKLNDFTIFLNRTERNVAQINLIDVKRTIQTPAASLQMYDEICGGGNKVMQLKALSKNFSKYHLSINYDKHLSADVVCKAIHIKDFYTKRDFSLNVEDSFIIYKGNLSTTLECENFKLQKITETVYRIPLLSNFGFLDPNQMFEILTNSRTYRNFVYHAIISNIDDKGSSYDVCELQIEFLQVIKRVVSHLGKFTTPAGFEDFCDTAHDVDEFLVNCLHHSRLQLIKRDIEQFSNMFT